MKTNTMNDTNVWVAGKSGFDKDNNRYYTLLYVALEKEQWYATVCCSDFDIHTGDMKDMSIEFLSYDKMNAITKPYNAKLFKQIEIEAKIQFLEMMEEFSSGAV